MNELGWIAGKGTIAGILGVASLLSGCFTAPLISTAPLSGGICPPPGTEVPARKTIMMYRDFIGCDIAVEVEFFSTMWPGACPGAPMENMVGFSFIEPGTKPDTQKGYMAAVPKAASDAIMTVKPGGHLVLRGGWWARQVTSETDCGVFIANSVVAKN